MPHISVKTGIGVVLFLALIFPFIFLGGFTQLLMDDYCRAGISLADYPGQVVLWFAEHNGRYINALMALLPVYTLSVYRIVLISLMVTLFCAFVYLMQFLFKRYGLSDSSDSPLLLAVVSFIAMIALLPSLDEFFYWYAAAIVYEVSGIFLIFLFTELLNFWFKGRLNFYRLGILTILINGNSELVIGITNLLLLSTLIFHYIRTRNFDFRLFLLNLISWVSTLLLIYAPGMTQRQNQFTYGGDLWGSAKVALFYGTKFIGVSMFSLTQILFYLFTFFFLWKLKKGFKKKLNPINPIILGILSYISVLSMVFIMYYAMGTFKSYGQWRAFNLLRLITFILFVVNIFNLVCFLKEKEINLRIPKYLNSLILVGFIFSLSQNKNYIALHEGFLSKDYLHLKKEMKKRENQIQNAEGEVIELQSISNTFFLNSGDEEIRKEEWVRKCYIKYLNMKYDKGFSDVKFKN
ncbi:hypothetical protein [Salinimicrobium flavum]|uniref:Uncharacterized protein n=1 Tax=Salinimicrobium flavum TaxID=1737065 RepID=A0ABW5IYC6_9FLAO